MTRRGLGRGLDALLPPEDERAISEGDRLIEVPVEDIEPNPNQPRRSFEEESLTELAESIAQLGVLQPLLVRAQTRGRFELVAGERRLRASRRAGLSRVPVVIIDTDERGSLERALVENIHREDLNPIEEAAAFRQLIDEGGLTQEELAGRLGRARATITNSLRLLDLPLGIQGLLAEGRLSGGHGRALLGINHSPFQERLARRIAEEGASVREAEDLVRRYQAMSGTVSEGARGEEKPPLPALAADAQRRLSDHLQTRVQVDFSKKRGKIVVGFSSLEELQRLVLAMLGDEPGSTRVVSVD